MPHTEPSQFLDPLSAEALHAHDQTFVFRSADFLAVERLAISLALPADLEEGETSPESGGWPVLAELFARLASFADPPRPSDLQFRLSELSTVDCQALRLRLKQIAKALEGATKLQGTEFQPTKTFAVPPLWSRRWSMLITGHLLPAYVVYMNIGAGEQGLSEILV